MPELAEVEFYRRVWTRAAEGSIRSVELHPKARVFRGAGTEALTANLPGSTLESSHASGKRMCFRFSQNQWLGVHLGMTGELNVQASDHPSTKHDHLLMRFPGVALVFTDPRMFGRIEYHCGPDTPPWWRDLPPDLASTGFTTKRVADFAARHGRLPLKAFLLGQEAFPGVGNWMADEILWRARLHPSRKVSTLAVTELRLLHSETAKVARAAIRTIASAKGSTFGDPPPSWLFHARWGKSGLCPRDGSVLNRASIGGRTTVWCGLCQPLRNATTQ